jgi:hypothetical protein
VDGADEGSVGAVDGRTGVRSAVGVALGGVGTGLGVDAVGIGVGVWEAVEVGLVVGEPDAEAVGLSDGTASNVGCGVGAPVGCGVPVGGRYPGPPTTP